ncbi:MAG: hypothetical protein RIQ60_416 [Pseudomonadota bacterium]|jgi:perosamine synthetase
MSPAPTEPARSRIHYTLPSITEAEVALVTDAARHGWGPRCYDYIERFEREFAAWLGVRHAIATSSCTGALHLGLAALGVGPGDEVIVPDTSWIASAAPVRYLGATPVLVDVLAHSWCVDPQRVEEAITPRTRAVIAVHLYGNLCELDVLREITTRHGLALIEDAAEAIGSVWQGRRAGSVGDFGVFSFHGTKTLSTGEGGMWVSNNSALYEQVLTLSNHGRARGQTRQFWPDRLGYKYKMSNLQAALGCAQLARVEDLVARKRAIFAAYAEALAALPGVTLNPEPPGTVNGCWMPTVVFEPASGVTRERLLAALQAADIDGRVFFWPLSGLSMFEARTHNEVACRLPGQAINLPSYHDMSAADLRRVIDTVLEVHRLARTVDQTG